MTCPLISPTPGKLTKRVAITNDISHTNPNPQNLENVFFFQNIWRVALKGLIYSLACGALGNMPGALQLI